MSLAVDSPSASDANDADATGAGDGSPGGRRSRGDRLMRRTLLLPADGTHGSQTEARKAFQTSIAVAAVRCTLMYLVFPFVLPALGIARGVGPAIGLAVNTVAMVCIVASLRRFFRADHPKRWWYATLGGAVFVLLGVLALVDVVALVR